MDLRPVDLKDGEGRASASNGKKQSVPNRSPVQTRSTTGVNPASLPEKVGNGKERSHHLNGSQVAPEESCKDVKDTDETAWKGAAGHSNGEILEERIFF